MTVQKIYSFGHIISYLYLLFQNPGVASFSSQKYFTASVILMTELILTDKAITSVKNILIPYDRTSIHVDLKSFWPDILQIARNLFRP